MPLETDHLPTDTHKDEGELDSLERFRLEITHDAEPMEEQRDAADEDMRFVNVDGAPWEGWLEDDDVGPRIRLVMDQVSDYLNRTYGEWTMNRVGVDFKPSDNKTSEDDAEMLNGLYRADYRNNSGKIATDNAVLETYTCGYGAFKLASRFENPEDPENDDQESVWVPIHNAFNSVFWDLSAKRIDKADARRCTVLTEFTKEAFEEVYPDASPVSAYEPDDRRVLDLWSTSEVGIFVATRYEIVREREQVFTYSNLSTGEVEVYTKENHEEIKRELKNDLSRKFIRERPIIRQHVEKSVFTGAEFLEKPHRIPGKWIPIIPMYGYRAYIDGCERYQGVVRKMKDPSRLFNTQVSQLAENSASSGQETPMFDPDQMPESHNAAWAKRNNKTWLPVKVLRNEDGTIALTGPIGYAKPPMLDQSTAALLQIVPSYLQGLTGGVPHETLDPKTSGKAIARLVKRANLNTQTIQDNVSCAIERSGTVWQEIAAEIFTGQRVMRTLGRDGTDSTIEMNKTVLDEETGEPIMINTLEGKRFKAWSDIGPQYDSVREETVEDLKGMAELAVKVPSGAKYLDAIFSIMIDNTAGVGLSPLKKLNRKNMILQGLVDPESDEEKQLVQQARQQQQQPQAQEQYLLALAKEAEGNAIESVAEAKKTESEVIENLSSAQKTRAETAQIANDMKNDDIQTLVKVREQVFKTLKELPIGNNGG